MGETAVALIGLALAGAGTGVSMSASAAEQDAMNQKTKEEVLRQKGYQKKSTGEFEKSLGQAAPKVAQQQIDSGAEARLADMQKSQAVPLGGASPLDLSAPNTVQASQSAALLGQQAQAKAKLGGYSDFDLQQWIKNLRAQQQIGMYSQFARQSGQVLPYELQAAARSEEDMRAAGTGLSAAGILTGLAGSAGLIGSGASAAESAAPVTSAFSTGVDIGEGADTASLGAFAGSTAQGFDLMKFLAMLGKQGGQFGSMFQQPKPQASTQGSIYSLR